MILSENRFPPRITCGAGFRDHALDRRGHDAELQDWFGRSAAHGSGRSRAHPGHRRVGTRSPRDGRPHAGDLAARVCFPASAIRSSASIISRSSWRWACGRHGGPQLADSGDVHRRIGGRRCTACAGVTLPRAELIVAVTVLLVGVLLADRAARAGLALGRAVLRRGPVPRLRLRRVDLRRRTDAARGLSRRPCDRAGRARDRGCAAHAPQRRRRVCDAPCRRHHRRRGHRGSGGPGPPGVRRSGLPAGSKRRMLPLRQPRTVGRRAVGGSDDSSQAHEPCHARDARPRAADRLFHADRGPCAGRARERPRLSRDQGGRPRGAAREGRSAALRQDRVPGRARHRVRRHPHGASRPRACAARCATIRAPACPRC